MISRELVIQQAVCECLRECYRWAQPPIDIDFTKVLTDDEFILDTEEDSIINRHYLSEENMLMICKHIKQAYNIGNDWDADINILLSYIQDPSRFNVKSKNLSSITKASEKVIRLIEECREFFKQDAESDVFEQTTILGAIPTTDKEAVEEYWHSRGWTDFKIRDVNIFEECYGDEDVITQDYPLEIKIDTWLRKMTWKIRKFFHNDFFCGLRIKFNKIKTWFTTKF